MIALRHKTQARGIASSAMHATQILPSKVDIDDSAIHNRHLRLRSQNTIYLMYLNNTH
jgi:hypothetical protein